MFMFFASQYQLFVIYTVIDDKYNKASALRVEALLCHLVVRVKDNFIFISSIF